MDPTPWILALAWLIALAVLVWSLWVLIPVLAGLAWIPTRPERVRRALELAQVQPGEVLYDLGAGDGRVLVMAAQEFKARAVGIEISPLQYAAAWLNARRHGVSSQVRLLRQDFFKADLSQAEVVFAYMTSRQTERIRPQLERKLRPGARVVTISFEMTGWQPEQFDEAHLLFLYRMPPKPGSLTTYLLEKEQA